MKDAANLRFAVALENLGYNFPLLSGVSSRIAIARNGLGQADAVETLCNCQTPLPSLLPTIEAFANRERARVQVDTVHFINRPLLSQVTVVNIEVDLFKIHAAVVFSSLAESKVCHKPFP